MSAELVAMLKPTPEQEKMLTGTPNAFSGIYGPDGRLVSEPMIDREGIVYGEIDLNRCIEPKQYHDILGHYNRFDIFRLEVNRAPLEPNRFSGSGAGGAARLLPESDTQEITDQALPLVRLQTPTN
jgi:hypothetical protein